MKQKFIISTTNTIENATIEKYIDLLSTNVVIGTNIFSDWKASFTDLFGGYSGTYQKKLHNIYQTAIKNIQLEAQRKGGNAVVGLKIDFDEISGQGKAMFMVSVVGMAVRVRYKAIEKNSLMRSNGITCLITQSKK